MVYGLGGSHHFVFSVDSLVLFYLSRQHCWAKVANVRERPLVRSRPFAVFLNFRNYILSTLR